ncbi:MAG: nitrate reductase [Porticoccaceae bacterium]|nr:nitrate reductase [Porticoccaceae bacterium]
MTEACQIKTTCPYCGVGCGVEASVDNNNIIAVSGDVSHPANFGKLCVKGSALHETMGDAGRLMHPKIEGRQTDWPTAIQTVADRLSQVRDQYGPEAIAFYLSGQLLTEDYYVANKLAKGFIGTGHVDTNSRLCMSSAVAGYKRAFGSDAVPCNYEDLEQCDLLVLTGSNAAWTHPVLYRRMAEAKKANPNLKIVVIDPRRTATCDLADLHLAIAPGSDNFIFSGLLHYLAANGLTDLDYIERRTEGFASALDQCASATLSNVSEQANIDLDDLATFYQWFAKTEKAITFYSQGINQSATGTDKCNAIINCHLATGKLGKVGAGPFSITGQPNAMGGREVGGLANMLAAHMDYSPENIATVAEYWGTDSTSREPGLKAVDLFDAVADGRIKAIWIMGTNPVVSMPNADTVKAALENCETVIVSDCIAETDTTATANILLPATGWGEKEGTVTNSERRISRQRSLLTPLGEARHDWWIMCQVAQAMGYQEGFAYSSPRDIFVEHAALSKFKNTGNRLFNIGALSALSETEYDQLEPIQWPVTPESPTGTKRLFIDGRFPTPSGKAQFISSAAELPRQSLSDKFPLALNSGRIRDQWHTMTRTGRAARLLDHIEQPFVAIHPDTALAYNLKEDDLARVTTAQGDLELCVVLEIGLKPNQIFIPIHWNNQFAKSARVDSLVAPIVDGISGQPEFKFTPAIIAKIDVPCWAVLVSRNKLNCEPFINWSLSPLDNNQGYLYQVAVSANFNWQDFIALKRLIDQGPAQAYEHYADGSASDERFICYSDQQIEMAIFTHSDKSQLPGRAWLQRLFVEQVDGNYWPLIASSTKPDQGKQVCSCFKVSEKTITDAIERGACSAQELGRQLQCGTNCGSCIPELNNLITQTLSLA